MPRAIAIETSGRVGSIAIVNDGVVCCEKSFEHGLRHAAMIVPIIDQLCRQQNWTPQDLEELYLSIGPGSFTGLRIGVTLAKTLAFATELKIVAVPTIRVLAENAPNEAQHLIIVLDAKREQIFTARFERDASGAWIEREPAHLDDLRSMLLRSPRLVHLLGEGIPYHKQFIPAGDPGVIVTSEETWRARANCVARLGTELSEQRKYVDPLTLVPLYIRRPEAEEKWEALHNSPPVPSPGAPGRGLGEAHHM